MKEFTVLIIDRKGGNSLHTVEATDEEDAKDKLEHIPWDEVIVDPSAEEVHEAGLRAESSGPEYVLAKTILIVEVLHPLDHNVDGLSLEQIHNECMDGDWSMIMDVIDVISLNKAAAIKACHDQETDPEFFGIEEDEEAETHRDNSVLQLAEAMKECFRAGVDPADSCQEMYKQLEAEIMREMIEAQSPLKEGEGYAALKRAQAVLNEEDKG
jgi:hypothetical protein